MKSLRSKRAAAAAAEAPAREASAAAEASTAPPGPRGTGAWRRDEDLVHVAGHGMHAAGKEDGIESGHAVGRNVPGWRILHDAGEGMRPIVLHSQSHRVRKIFLESVGRHAFQAVGIHAGHEFLEAQDRDAGPCTFQRLGSHNASE